MTGMPHRPSSTDGHLLVSLLITFVPRLSTTIGLPQEDARRYARPIGYAYRLGRCGNWRTYD